eukprot:1186419-Prorocentrum_minimum.AAC.1
MSACGVGPQQKQGASCLVAATVDCFRLISFRRFLFVTFLAAAPAGAGGAGPPRRGRADSARRPAGDAVPAPAPGDSRLVRRENIPTLPTSDWSVVRVDPRFLRRIGGALSRQPHIRSTSRNPHIPPPLPFSALAFRRPLLRPSPFQVSNSPPQLVLRVLLKSMFVQELPASDWSVN